MKKQIGMYSRDIRCPECLEPLSEPESEGLEWEDGVAYYDCPCALRVKVVASYEQESWEFYECYTEVEETNG